MSAVAEREGSVLIRSVRIDVAEGEEDEGLVPGCRGARPRGVSTRMRKWPVKGGPREDGRESASIWGRGEVS